MTKTLAKLVLLAVILITALASVQISSLEFDYEFENFFPRGDTELDFYHEYMDKFTTDVDFVLVGIKNEKGIFHEDFLLQSKALSEAFKKLEYVDRVTSPFDARDFAIGPFGPIDIPYLHPEQPERYASDSARIYEHNKGVGSLFATDARSISMVIQIEPNLSKEATDSLYANLTELTASYHFDELHLAGKAIGQKYFIEKIRTEFVFFFILAILLIVLLLTLIYRSLWGTIVPLVVVLLSVIWLLGLMGLTGKSIDIMTALLPMVLFVVAISDVIHVLSRYFEEIRNGLPKHQAIKVAYKQVGIATFLTSLTTAMGFLTLMTSSITPVRELGIYAASGVFIAFILAFSFLPAILVLTKVPRLAYKEPSSVMWNRVVRWAFIFSIRNRVGVVLVTVGLIVVSLIGAYQIKIDNFLLEDVGEGESHRESFEFFEANFAGVRPFEMYITTKSSDATLLDYEVVNELLEVETYLKDQYGVGFLLSPLELIRTVHQARYGGQDSAHLVPSSKEEFDKTMRFVKRFAKRPEFNSLITSGWQEGRFTGKVIDVGGNRTAEMNEEMLAYFQNEASLQHIDYRLTGMALLIDKNNESLSLNMMNGLIIAFLVVGLIMGVIFRSVRMAVISLVPNVVPLLAIAGLMGLTGVDLKVATSIIFGIAFGIAVDDSIHYLSKFRLEQLKGRSLMFALKRTSISTGKAILLTSLILCCGFISLATSTFTSTYYIGVLISATLIFAVFADLLLLPALLVILLPRKKKTSEIKKSR